MLNKVIKAIEKYGMFDLSQNITVALSGGADSVCLLYVLCELKEKYGLSLSAVHINHMLRGEESDRDELFVKKLCKGLNIPLTVKRIEVKKLAENTGESIELAARNARYTAFKEAASGVVATAHSADDNLETLLFNVTRGSGLKGACGIPPIRDMFIRPLIFCGRAEIEDYLKQIGADFVTDSSNLTDDFTRNFLRHNVVPKLKKINPAITTAVSNMCSSLREDEDFLFSTAKKIYTLCLREYWLDKELLTLQHPAVCKRVISLYLAEQFGATCDNFHLEKCLEILKRGGRTGLSGNLSAECSADRFFVIRNGEKILQNPGYKVETKKHTLENLTKINNLFLKNAIDCDKIEGSLVVRVKNEGDAIRLNNRNCTKSLKKLFNELKIPKELREYIPVAADDGGIVWVYGVGIDGRVAIDENTKTAIEFVTTK